jgi:hypothetical protein
MIKEAAKELLEVGYNIIPLLKNEKHNLETEILTKKYSVDDFEILTAKYKQEHTNLGINVAKSFNGLLDLDIDSDEAIKLAPKFFPLDTCIFGRRNKEKLEHTHFLFLKDQDYSNFNLDRLDINGKKIIEFRTSGNLVVPPSTTPSKTDQKLLMPRVWINKKQPIKVLNILKIFNWCSFASFVYSFVESANTGAICLDACVKRYTDATDDERIKFLEILYSTKFPEKWNVDKDFNIKKFRRIIKGNNNDSTKTAGYKKLADYLKINPLELKRALSWIGKVPDEKTESKKTVVDFFENSLDMETILKTEFPPIQFTVRPVMPEGLGLVAGRPKAMKSWTMLDLAYCVQNNLNWMNHEVVQGDVLYLALEDNPRRMKDRITKLGHSKCKKHPTIVTESPYLNYGLEESIRAWTKQVFHPRLVIVDTLAKVKNQWNRSDTAYDKDNKLLRDVQHLAGELSITIIFVSHLGKAQQDYSWDKIQGSTGMQGMTDFMWMLDRGDQGTSASLKGRGRDMEDFEYALTWNEKTWKYDCEGKLYEIQMQENRREIIEAMKHYAYTEKQLVVKPNEVANFLGQTSVKGKSRISKTMQRMLNSRDLIKGEVYGTYKLFTSLPDASSINFENDKMN